MSTNILVKPQGNQRRNILATQPQKGAGGRMFRLVKVLIVLIGIGVVALIGRGVSAKHEAEDVEAKAAGFLGRVDRHAAVSAGISEPAKWRDKQAADAARELKLKQARQEKAQQESLAISACVQAEYAIRARLKAPSTAKFPYCYEQDIRVAADKVTFFVRGHVDAQNSFGAMLRSTFIVKLRHQGGDSWQVETAALN